MTKEEREVVLLLARAWDAFMMLPEDHPMDKQEMCTIIHRAQEKVLARSGRRLFDESNH